MSGQDSVGLQTRICYDLSGGMVTNWNFAKVAINQYQLLLNGNLTKDGAIDERQGRAKLNPIALPGNPTVISLSTLGQINTGDLILAAAGGGLFEMSSGIPGPNLRPGISATAYLASTTLADYNFYCNGVDQPFMTKGTLPTTFQIGITGVTNAEFAGFSGAAVAGGDGTATGTGKHRVSFRYRSTATGARSNPNFDNPDSGSISSITITLTPGNQTYEITIGAAAVSADPQVDFIDYFVQEVDAVSPDSPYYYLGSSPNAIGVYDFGTDVSDETLVILETLDTDDTPAPITLSTIISWRGRLLGKKDDYHVGYSKQRVDANGIIDLPTSWPADNELNVGVGDGDPLITVVEFNDYVLAFKRRSVWILLGDFDSPGFGFKKLKANYTNVGLLNQRSIVQAGERLFFVTDDLKFYWFSITDFNTEQLRLTDPPPSDPVGNIFREFASNFRQFINLVSFNFAQFTQIWIAFSNGGTGMQANQNFNVFVYDWNSNNGQGAWHIHTGMDIASSVLARDQERNYFVYTGDYYGFVWKTDQGNGDGAEINGTSTGANYNELTLAGIVGPGFLVGEKVQGLSTGSTGIITFVDPAFIRINQTDGLFLSGDTITNNAPPPPTPPIIPTTATITNIFGVLNDGTMLFTDALLGVFATIVGGTGVDQIQRITGVPSFTQLEFDGGWAIVPDNTSDYTIGGIDFDIVSRDDWCDDSVSLLFDKLGWYLDLDIEMAAGSPDPMIPIDPKAIATIDFYIDRGQVPHPAVLRNLNAAGAYWGFGIWGTSVWLGSAKSFGQVGFNLYFKQISHRIRNRYAGFHTRINGWVYTFQTLGQIRTI